MINITQFFIIAGAGAVSSTVVGHLKTCSIVMLGWAVSGRKATDKSVVGIILAIGGIIRSVIHFDWNELKPATNTPFPPAIRLSCIDISSSNLRQRCSMTPGDHRLPIRPPVTNRELFA